MIIINCTGNYNVYPHGPFGNLKGFTITSEVSMPVPDWINNLEAHHFQINICSGMIQCDAYIRGYRIDINTRLITEITLSTTGRVSHVCLD
uniref:Uncharacterized protein n=1 Tax=viral metagenome TaxID=1070528 RepID=A0A6M3LWX3_9ZZZZ